MIWLVGGRQTGFLSRGEVEFSTVFLIRITSHTALCSWNACFGSAAVTLNSPKRKSIKTSFSRLLRPVDCSFFPILVKGRAEPGNHRKKKGGGWGRWGKIQGRRPSNIGENKNHLKKHELRVTMMTPSYWPNLGGGGEEKQQEKEETVWEGNSPEASPPPSSTQHPNKLGAHNHMASSLGERQRGGDRGNGRDWGCYLPWTGGKWR